MLNSKKAGDLLLLLNGIALVILFNSFASFYFFRIDLTEEQRYTIKPQTKELLKNLDDSLRVKATTRERWLKLEGDPDRVAKAQQVVRAAE